jgi:hypothetical protein
MNYQILNPALAEAVKEANGGRDPNYDHDDQAIIQQLAALLPLDYQRQRLNVARNLGVTVPALDKLVKGARAEAEEAESALPHWKVEPWNATVSSAKLLEDIEKVFRRYIVLPEGASVALALWTLHAWTVDAGDISPFLVLVSPTMHEVDDYLWEVYQRAPTKRDGSGDFTWKDPAAAKHFGLPMPAYVIGGMDPDFREQLYHAGRAMDEAGIR